MAQPLIVPVRLRSTGEGGRKVTWLELFFDLIFVAAVAQVAEPLRHDYTLAELTRFGPLFLLIWWAWTGQSVFATRFDTDDMLQRGLTLLQVFVVAAMAANAKDALDSRSSAGFAAAYAAVRFVLVAQYVRARHVPGARALTDRYVAGHGGRRALAGVRAGAVADPYLISDRLRRRPRHAVACRAPQRPRAARRRPPAGTLRPVHADPARRVGRRRHAGNGQDGWTPAAASAAFLGMAVLFALWWWVFDGALAASERPVRTKRDALRFHIWSYAHFPLYLGVVVTGVGFSESYRCLACDLDDRRIVDPRARRRPDDDRDDDDRRHVGGTAGGQAISHSASCGRGDRRRRRCGAADQRTGRDDRAAGHDLRGPARDLDSRVACYFRALYASKSCQIRWTTVASTTRVSALSGSFSENSTSLTFAHDGPSAPGSKT